MDVVSIRFIEKADLPYVQKYVSMKEVSATTNIPYPYPDHGAKEWYEFITKGKEEERLYAFAILYKEQFAGSISITIMNREKGTGSIDYWIAPSFWNKGIGTKAAEEAINYGNKYLNLNTYETGCLAENLGSQKVLEKNGFKLVKEFKLGSGEKHEGKIARLYCLKRE